MATNTLEIIIKANSKQAVTSLGALDKSLDKVGTTSAKGFDALKLKFKEMDKTLSSPAGMKALVGTAGAVVGALTGVGLAVKGLADDYMDYAFQVKDFGRIIGATPEEASKLIQVADDVRLSVESMTTAMRSAITKGYAPTIEGLGKLSDEYLAIQDPIERSRFLVERFGRSGLEMAKLMELGSDKISEMGDSVEGTARLMTDKGIKAAEDYYTSLDELGEVIEDISKSLGAQLLPSVVDATKGLTNLAQDGMDTIAMFALMQKATEDGKLGLEGWLDVILNYMTAEYDRKEVMLALAQLLDDTTIMQRGYNAAVAAAPALLKAYGVSSEYVTDKTDGLRISIEEVGRSMRDTALAAIGVVISTGDITESLEEAEEKARAFRQSIASLPENISMSFTLQIPDITTELSNLVNNKKWVESGGAAAAQFIEGLKGKLATLSAAELQGVAANLAAVELAAKVQVGQLSKAEAIAQIQQAFGLSYSEAALTVTAAIEADPDSPKEILAFLDAQIGANPLTATVEPEIDQAKYDAIFGSGPNGLTKPSEAVVSPKLDMAVYGSMVKIITKPLVIPVTIRYTTTGSPGLSIGEQEKLLGRDLNGNGVIGRATGGPVSPGQWYMVGERGPEMFIPNSPGKIVPNNQTTNNSPVNITNNFSVVASTALDIRELARQVAREQQRAGSK